MDGEVVWKKYKGKSVQDFETWIRKMDYEPYKHDKKLQSIDWVEDLTAAIKKVSPMVGEGKEIEYLYWDKLNSWEFMLNCFSIARAFGGVIIADKNNDWKSIYMQFRIWVDSTLSYPNVKEADLSGASFFYDMRKGVTRGRC
ncbi:MAG: hypothetical protein WC347_12500 [Smithellaceae bacterium]|jgi:hypothetical protein